MFFSVEAPRYWALSLPAIPLLKGEKRPAINRWTDFAFRMPSEQEQSSMLLHFHDGNIGLVLGPQSGLVIIDIDTVDPKILALLDRILPKSPWVRIGARGMALAYRYKGHRGFKLRHPTDGMIVELLSEGQQIVLPPSIHPATKEPYTANSDLLAVLDQISELPLDIETTLRDALRGMGIDVHATGTFRAGEFIAAGARDSKMVSHAGIIARDIARGTTTLVEGLQQMEYWVDTFTEKVDGDELDPEKAKEKVLEFLVRDVSGTKRSLPPGWDEGLSDDEKTKLGLPFGPEHERWDADRIGKYLLEEFTNSDKDSQRFRNAVDTALGRIAGNRDLKEFEQEGLLKFISNQGGIRYPFSGLKKDLARLRRGELSGNGQREIVDAFVRDKEPNGEIRYDGGYLWQWGGACWEKMVESKILDHIAREYGEEKLACRINDHAAILKGIKTATSIPLASGTHSKINFANGVLDEQLQLLPHSPDYGFTYVLPYRYRPDEAGNCPTFMKLLQHSWGDDDDFQQKVDALQEAVAATLFGVAPKYQRVFCLKGAAHTGKTRILKIVEGLMPADCMSCVHPSDWNDKFLPAAMFGKLLNFCGEISESRFIEGANFKEIVEGAIIQAQHKNQQVFKFSPRCAHWFAGNHNPKSRDTSDGFIRRWLFLEFTKVVSKGEKVVDIDEIILDQEREQIAAWAVQGLPRLMRNKDYTLPASHKRMSDLVANQINPVRYFMATCPRLRVGLAGHDGMTRTVVTERELYTRYEHFTYSTRGKPVGPQTFHQRMTQLQHEFGIKQVIRNCPAGGQETIYEGIAILSERDGLRDVA